MDYIDHPFALPRFLRQAVLFLLVLEMVLAGLGFCGHGHTHVDSLCGACVHRLEIHEGREDAEGQGEKDCESGENRDSGTDFHCPCLGSFIGEEAESVIDVHPEFSPLTPRCVQAYEFAWSPRIDHPPRTSA